MYFLALATDYDGTIANHGAVTPETLDALRRFKQTGRKLILVTGREVPDLQKVFRELAIFDRVVAENGALILEPSTGRERLLAPALPAEFIDRLRKMNVEPLSVGRAIAATWEPHQATVLNVIRELGLDLQITFNKGAVMILPPGISKASGLLEALVELEISAHNVTGVGDAENDHAFLQICGCAAAVANALPSVKEAADIVLIGDHGAGVSELVNEIIAHDADIAPATKHGLLVGVDRAGKSFYIKPHGGSVLVIGPSGCGKSTLATALTERMALQRFEFCVLDPEGDYLDLKHAVCVGSAATAPDVPEALKLCHNVGVNLVINTQALGIAERQSLFGNLLAQISHFRALTGRPHWLVIDEAHQVLPAFEAGPRHLRVGVPSAAILLTMFPEALAADAVAMAEVVLAFGSMPLEGLRALRTTFDVPMPTEVPVLNCDELLYWEPHSGQRPVPLKVDRPVQIHKRHVGKYASGDVGAWRSFYFRGPGGRMNVGAENLYRFLDVAHAVDDETWEYHRQAGDYSAWFRHVIKDEDLAREAKTVEEDTHLNASESRRIISKAIRRRYAAPGAPTSACQSYLEPHELV
ncbi:HAD-IIB family hydrolase [Acidisoma sp. L85]|uniref:HAD-IIB family hydrolase n=1 Tax=Acidisoma sp. L85 TaxID=1641850 RepID=UPI00131A7B0D|nr:HAD-IIB family hydrolase [Acidisoma sp. L85]